MPTIEFMHRSMGGTYWIECEVIEKIDEQHFRIRYEDPFVSESFVETVERQFLKFPRFSEYQFS